MVNFLKVILGLLGLVGIIVVGIPIFLMVFFWIQSWPKDVSSDPKYSEIYLQTFEAQNPIFLNQRSDTKDFYLDTVWSDIAKIEKGARLQVKKVAQSRGFATINVKVLVAIDDPHLSPYRDIDAHALIINGHCLGYSDDVAQFDLQYLKNIEIKTLHLAVQYDDVEAINHLIESGANLNQKNLDGMTPLHYARTAAIALYLLEKGANPDETDKRGKTLLHYAAHDNLYDIVKLLIARGAMIDQKDLEENTPLLVAADAEHFDIVRFLLDSGADPLVKGQYQNTVLLYAAHHDQLEIAKLALKLGADPKAVCSLSQMTGVLFAARNHNIRMAKLFVEAGAPVDCANNFSDAPLHYAVGNLSMLQYLVGNGADIHRTDRRGRTVLHGACDSQDLGAFRIVSWLLAHGARADQPDNDGMTPLAIAEQYGCKDVAQLLKNHTNSTQ